MLVFSIPLFCLFSISVPHTECLFLQRRQKRRKTELNCWWNNYAFFFASSFFPLLIPQFYKLPWIYVVEKKKKSSNRDCVIAKPTYFQLSWKNLASRRAVTFFHLPVFFFISIVLWRRYNWKNKKKPVFCSRIFHHFIDRWCETKNVRL